MRPNRHVRTSVRHAHNSNAHLQHKAGIVGIVAIAVVCLVGLAFFAAIRTAQAAPSSVAAQSASAGANPGGPGIRLMKRDGSPIENDDVVKFVEATGMPRTLGPRHPVTGVQAQLLTSAQISARLRGESTGDPDSTVLWFVQMHGTFVFPGPPGEPAITAHLGYEVFDPASGNILMFGGLG